MILSSSEMLKHSQTQVHTDLLALLTQQQWPSVLVDAVRHAVLLGGKRVRPALCYAACLAVGQPINPAARRAALAVELIHCYSLVHDDLPCMDDDVLRRGQPTCHVEYGEANALLAGDVLQSLAFEVLTGSMFESERVVPQSEFPRSAIGAQIVLQQVKALAAASSRMVAGQVLDLQAEQQQVSESHLRQIHLNKTGALIVAALKMGALAGGLTFDQLAMQQLEQFGQAVGLAFQVQDDVLDVTATTEVLGKTAGTDQKLQKSTYPLLLGLAAAQQLAADLHVEALAALAEWSDAADPLRQIAQFLLVRQS